MDRIRVEENEFREIKKEPLREYILLEQVIHIYKNIKVLIMFLNNSNPELFS
jgi:hypothetical protein